MHTVFLVGELVLEIFTLVGDSDSDEGKKDVAALARTCKAFSHVALGQLWKMLFGVAPLLSLFPLVEDLPGGRSRVSETVLVAEVFSRSSDI
jgi:hypothetical protein